MTARKYRAPRWMRILAGFILISTLSVVVIASWAVSGFHDSREESMKNIEQQGLQPAQDNGAFEPPEDDASLEHINVLLVGTDSEDGVSRSDTIMIGRYDAASGEVRLASLMRDTYVDIPGHGRNKINAAFSLGGLALLRDTIETNFEFPLQYYAMVNFDGFTSIVDTLAPDGIEIEIASSMHYVDRAGNLEINFEEGLNVMDGSQALKYVRFRSDGQNDFGRVARQQKMLKVLQNELLSVSGAARIPRILGAVEPYIQTNIDQDKLFTYGSNFFIQNDEASVQTITIPEQGGYSQDYSEHAGQVLIPDLAANIEVLKTFFGEESFTTEGGTAQSSAP
jgi:polyisoprenyl-teichoic acid--peptidoglycan teichoic acid transferase